MVRSGAPPYLSLESFAYRAGLHPELVRRLVSLGLLDPRYDATGRMWFHRGQLATAARIQRLRVDFALNYAAVGLVVDLLDRVAELESALRHRRRGPVSRQNLGG